MRMITLLVLMLLALVGPAEAESLCLADAYGSTWTLTAREGVVTGTWQPGEGLGVGRAPVALLGTVRGALETPVLALMGVAETPPDAGFPGVVGAVVVRIAVTAADTWLDVTTPLLAWGAQAWPCAGEAEAETPATEETRWSVRVPESWFELGERERAAGIR